MYNKAGPFVYFGHMSSFFTPPPALTGVGHKASRRGVTSVHEYVVFVTGVSQMSQLTCKFTCKFYIHIYVRVSLGAHNFGNHAIPLKFGMILTKTLRVHVRVAPGHAHGGDLCTLDTCLVIKISFMK